MTIKVLLAAAALVSPKASWAPAGEALRAGNPALEHAAPSEADGPADRTLLPTGAFQLRNPRTGVTCSTIIVPASPDVDAGILWHRAPRDRGTSDPIVRHDLSPCGEGSRAGDPQAAGRR